MSNEGFTNGGYTSYQSMVTTVNTALSDLEKICGQLKMEENKKDLAKLRQKLADHRFAVGVMGEFKRGKSTVINSLLEQEIMPSDILPCSATMNRVTYDLRPHVVLHMRDGSQKDIPVEELASYVTKLTGENESRAADVDEAVVYYPCRFCQNGVDIVDTPGLNDDERMNKISEEVIPKLDAVIMVITPDNPFSMSEAEFVRSKLMTSDLSRLIFLVNKIDQVRRKADRERTVKSIRDRIEKSVLEKTAAVYGLDSKEYKDAEKKMGNIRVYPISALDALDGKMTGDQELIEGSGTLVFEAALTKMLTEERGALELSTPLSAIQRTAADIVKTATTRKSALNLSAQEFAENQNEALAQIKEMRLKKQQEKRRLKERAADVKVQMEQTVVQNYPELKNRLREVVTGEAERINLDTLKNEAGQKEAREKIQKAVAKEMEAEMALITERVQVQLQQIIGEEAVIMEGVLTSLSKDLDKLQLSVTGAKGSSFGWGEVLATGADAIASNFFYGIGGIVAGYRNGGIGGAVVGGGISAITSTALYVVLASASVAGLPLVLLSAAAGTLAGKFATQAIFSKNIAQKKLKEIKESMNAGIDSMIQDLQERRELENWADDIVDKQFNALISAMEEECERMLRDSESSMDAIKQDLTENEMHRQQMEEKCDNAIAAAKQIMEKLQPIADKVNQVLNAADAAYA